jgi:hypothetical protein
MTDASQPLTARGTKWTAGVVAMALLALLAFAPMASAGPPAVVGDPLASGATTVALNQGFVNSLKKRGVTMIKVAPAEVTSKKITFTVTGGSLDPTTGLGTLFLGGGIKFSASKKSTSVKGFELNTKKKVLTAKVGVGGKKVVFAKVSGYSFARNGFGVDLAIKKLKLDGAAATQLNEKLGITKPKAFAANKLMGSSTSETQPATVTLLPSGNMTFTADSTLLAKLADVEAKVETIPPTTQAANVFTSPITGGTISPITGETLSPTGIKGVTQKSSGGLRLVQKLPMGPSTTLTLGAMYLDLSEKAVTVEVIAESNAEVGGKKPLNLGNLGRSTIAEVTVGGITADPATRKVSVNASAVLQPISAEILEGFVQVYQGYLTAFFQTPGGGSLSKEDAEKAATKKVENDHIKAGNALGTFAFTAQAQ